MPGRVESYVHHDGRVGSLVVLGCKTDFAARTGEFRELAVEIAIQVAAMGKFALYHQALVKNPNMTVQGLIANVAEELKEEIRVVQATKFEVTP